MTSRSNILVVGSGSQLAQSFIETVAVDPNREIVHCDILEREPISLGNYVRADFSDISQVQKIIEGRPDGRHFNEMVIFAVDRKHQPMGTDIRLEVDSLCRSIAILYNSITSFGRQLRRSNAPGKAVLLSSINAVIPVPGLAGYCIAKSTIPALIQCASREFSPFLTVNAVAPGPVYKKGGVLDAFPGFLAGLEARHVIAQRLARPSDVIPAIEFLLSSSSKWITGQSITVDGGVSFNWGDFGIAL